MNGTRQQGVKVARNYLATCLLVVAIIVVPRIIYADDMDARIVKLFKESYVNKTYLKDDPISIQSTNGVVKLVGTVDDVSHRSLAYETAIDLAGVKRVENFIQVESKAKEPSDAWLALKVKTALLFHPSVSAVRTQVNVVDGVATLTGKAESHSEKELATEYTKDVEGIKSVKNNMSVESPTQKQKEKFREKIDDASITAQIKVALLTHRSTSMISTRVNTKEGEVTLTGSAKNQAEKDLVTKIANDIHGVVHVINNMAVE